MIPDLPPMPSDPADRERWHRDLRAWRADARRAVGYDGARYTSPALAWAARSFVCGVVMLWDEDFYDAATGRFTVEEYLATARAEFGGFDAVVLWHAYPRIGVDDRNQFDFYRQVPGGLAGLRSVVDRCRALGVRVILDYNPWDTGTRAEPAGELDALAELVREVGADGVFLDTLGEAATGLRERLGDAVVLQSEHVVPLERVFDHQISWVQWPPETPGPHLLRNKWFEPRQMQHLVRRWHRDHTGELHLAWLNGAGVVVWENVFGSWNPWRETDRAMLRAMRTVWRGWGRLFATGEWTPFVATARDGVYASRWQAPGVRLWTIVNATDEAVHGTLVPERLADGEHGVELLTGAPWPDGMLAGTIPARGIAAFLAGSAPDAGDRVRFPGVERDLDVRYRLRESGTYGPAPLVDVAFPELHQVVTETRRVSLTAYAIDAAPVTNDQYRRFLDASGYRPASPENFLRHWPSLDGPAPEQGPEPVVHVDPEDAAAYAAFHGARLPTEAEWQHALESGRAGHGRVRVWEWTGDHSSDGHTRSCVIKGGADFEAEGSEWYADGGLRPPQWTTKFVLSWPALDRCATVGFRCAVDLPGESP
ncbi:SUMF1/EgtB/PvdO family nonheme iron enzyme [Micromonospora cathayae]|uniref:SUMF1/EgtB/PvdO family nonheme iron enzyme n=1 Tax=Micromonospora cathayae TaxID=3028804 RepID=A0ABY7ZLA7_9ACTN|nr:SUMF1/EgtB/PvdO family nonheme iron enzyme [Micromonospora sp. HUAS 3]WDZ83780.1 SUMF1/EgtB/PvdO family nonheme iron enzyme [Micromonospora sp. HUAS 3]